MHILECLVDAAEVLTVSDELVDLEISIQVVVDETRQLGAALDASESAAFPDTTGDQLEC